MQEDKIRNKKKYTIEKIRTTQKGKGFYLNISNEIATYLIYWIQSLEIHPNYFTLLSLFFGIGFSYFLLAGELIISAIMVNLLYLFDNLDGQWARIKKMTSSFGALFDSLVDGWNITIVIVSVGIYLYGKEQNVYYLYFTLLFFILSFLDFALEKNSIIEQKQENGKAISLQENSGTKLRNIILWVSSATSYDKWILMLTLGAVFNMLDIVLVYIIATRLLSYAIKLLKIYLKYK